MFVVFDLDGTLADCSHRIHMIGSGSEERDHPDWDAFYRACVHDKPTMPIINTLIAFRNGGARGEIWTGRSDLVHAETENWLQRHCIAPHLLKNMRPHGTHSSDAEMKRLWLFGCDDVPNLVFEDRQRVVDMWREEGIRCCQVAQGDF